MIMKKKIPIWTNLGSSVEKKLDRDFFLFKNEFCFSRFFFGLNEKPAAFFFDGDEKSFRRNSTTATTTSVSTSTSTAHSHSGRKKSRTHYN